MGWRLFVLLSIALSPILFAAALDGGNSDQHRSDMPRVWAEANARVVIASICDAQHAAQRLLDAEQSTAGWPDEAVQAYSQLLDAARRSQAEAPRLKAVFQRIADGDLSAAAQAEADMAMETTQKFASEFRAKGLELERISAEIGRREVARKKAEQAALDEQNKKLYGWGLGMTFAGYDRLREGMSKWDVDQVLGVRGEEQASGQGMEIYMWSSESGMQNVTATFQGGELVSKAQLGL